MVMSSAKSMVFPFNANLSKLFIKRRNNVADCTEPCVTPIYVIMITFFRF